VRRPVTLSLTVPALVAGAILLALVPAASGSGPGVLRQRADSLRSENSTLASRTQSVALELYGLDSRIRQAREQLTAATARSAAMRRQRASVAQALGIARRARLISQRALGDRLRDLYEEGDTDPLAILLGADSLDQAVARLDDLRSIAGQDRAVIGQTRVTSRRMRKLAGKLAVRGAELDALKNQASAAVVQLSGARTERASYLQQLVGERQFNLGRISSLESEAQAAAAKAARINAAAPAAASTPIAFAPTVAPVQGAHMLTVVASGYALPGHTATGAPVGIGVVAVDPSAIPLGTRMSIPGYGDGIAADVGPGIQGAMIDLWFPTAAQALAWGRRIVTITLH
jgi:3D (Asp-Asp-Asp) domain-containing protein/septal ring factor EnvC (AmiA/AmiB activator)